MLLAGCRALPPGLAIQSGSSPGPAPRSTEEVLALVGTVGAMRLAIPTASGVLRAVPDPELSLDTAWISCHGTTLLATGLDGGMDVGSIPPGAGPGASGVALAWTSALGDLGGRDPLRAFGSLQPATPGGPDAPATSRDVAFVEGDPGSGSAGRLVVETLTGAKVARIDLPTPAEAAPAWLADGRIAIVDRDRNDRPVAVLADPATGRASPVRAGTLRSIAIEGGVVASIDEAGRVGVGRVGDWLDGRALGGIAPVAPAQEVLQAVPSAAGDEIALVVADTAGDAASIRIDAAAGGWHEIARFGLPSGANRAVVCWLAAP